MTAPDFDALLLEAARKALPLGLCEECFGRLFGQYGHGWSNSQRARRVAEALGVALPQPKNKCAVCEGEFDRLDRWVERVLAAGSALEWRRFTCGSRWAPETLAKEESTWRDVGTAWAEGIRGAFNRELGKRVEARSGRTGGTERPDVVFLADIPAGRVEATSLPLYFRGRYRKLDRSLPQTRWLCRHCRGRGCVHCDGSGKTYPTSVEEIIARPLLLATGGSGSRFHGMGREDIDARMLGEGRPFVIEVREPKRRTVEMVAVQAALEREGAGRVEVEQLVPCGPDEVVRVKESSPAKSYRVSVLGDIPGEKVNEGLRVALAQTIAQRTPTRVAHRRADRVRTRRILGAKLVEASEGRFVLELRAEAGTYIKEWVEGDGGRTTPSLAGLVGAPLSVESLDVIAVHDGEVKSDGEKLEGI